MTKAPSLVLLPVLAAIVVSCLLPAPLRAEKGYIDGEGEEREDEDHNAARAAVRHGEAMPLADVLARIAPDLPGEIVEVEFEREHGRWIYEFKVIDTTGRFREVHVDAATGRVLSGKND